MRRDVKIGLALGVAVAVFGGALLLGGRDSAFEDTAPATPEVAETDGPEGDGAEEAAIDGASRGQAFRPAPTEPTDPDLIARAARAAPASQPAAGAALQADAPPAGAEPVKVSPLERGKTILGPTLLAHHGAGPVPDVKAEPESEPKGDPTSAPGEPTASELGSPAAERLPLTHTVLRGDTLFSLSKHYYGSGEWMMEIARANPKIKRRPNRLIAGMKLTIPKLSKQAADLKYYRVQRTDTLRSIARRMLGDPAMYIDIYEANVHILKSPDIIPVGAVLRIPAVAQASTERVRR